MEQIQEELLSSNDKEVIPLKLKSKQEIYQSHMPFIENGGLFIRTHRQYRMGQEIVVLLELVDDNEHFTVEGKVVWITPIGAQGGLPAGIGIQLQGEHAHEVQKKVTAYVAGLEGSDLVKDTM